MLVKFESCLLMASQILCYEDPAHIQPFAEKFAIYKDHFQPWASQSNAMHQYFRMLLFFPIYRIFWAGAIC